MTAPSAFPRAGIARGRAEVESGFICYASGMCLIRRDLFLSVNIPVAPASDIPDLFLALHH